MLDMQQKWYDDYMNIVKYLLKIFSYTIETFN